MNTRKSTQKKNQRKQSKRPRRRNGGQTTLSLPRRLTAMPDRFRTNLKFWKAEAIDLGTTSFNTSYLNGSGAFPDPVNTSVKYNQFTELSNFYSSYKIHSSRIVVELVNTSPNSVVQLTVTPVNLSPAAFLSNADYNVDLRKQSYARSKMGATQGSPVCRIAHSMATQRIFGNPMVWSDDKFTALINVNPENMWFWVIGVYSLTTIVNTTPVLMNVFLDCDIEFYDRRMIVDTTLYNSSFHAHLTPLQEMISEAIEESPEAFPEDYKLEKKCCSCSH